MIAERIRAARAAKGWTQVELARRMGLKKSHTGQLQVSQWETGRRRPGAVTLPKIATALGVTTDYLLGMENER